MPGIRSPRCHLSCTTLTLPPASAPARPQVTSVVVSHDSGFLDAVCSAIIHYEDNFKLKKYLGNLSKFVQQRPEAAAYYNLADATTKWVMPEPGFLEVSARAGGRRLWQCSGSVGALLHCHNTASQPAGLRGTLHDIG